MIQDKIKDRDSLKRTISRLKNEKKTIVFTNGCFDIMHAGHAGYLEEAKRHGDILVVGVNSDDSVKRLKGPGRPIMKQDDRLSMLAALESVDFVTVFDEDDPENIITELSPDAIAKGEDWKEEDIIGSDFVKKSGGKVIRIRFRDGCSTTSIIKKIRSLR